MALIDQDEYAIPEPEDDLTTLRRRVEHLEDAIVKITHFLEQQGMAQDQDEQHGAWLSRARSRSNLRRIKSS